MEDASKPRGLLINYIGLSSMTTATYGGQIDSTYSIQYDNVFADQNHYLDLLLYMLVLLVALVCTGLMLFHVTVIIFSKFYLYRFLPPEFQPKPLLKVHDQNVPGVSILKPLTGVDDAVLVNLRSFFYLDYPKYELLFCVADPQDPVVPHVKTLIKAHEGVVDAKLIFSENGLDSIMNPKINNMNPGYLEAKYELVLISDAGIFMYPNTLSDMVITMVSEEEVGLVHQIPFMLPYRISQNLLALEKNFKKDADSTNSAPAAWIHQLVYFGCWHAKMYMGAAMMGINCTTGMSCLMRKDALDSVGGIEYFGQFLAEDFFISKFFYDSGWRVRVASQPAWQNAIVPSIKQFQDRMLRWYQLRLAMVPVASLLEPFSGCFINGLVHALAYAFLFPQLIDPVAFFLCHVLIWFLLDFVMLHQIHPGGMSLAVSKASFLSMWALYESTAIFTLIRAICTRHIQWRGKKYRLQWGGRATRVEEEKSLPVPDTIKLADTPTMTLLSTSISLEESKPCTVV